MTIYVCGNETFPTSDVDPAVNCTCCVSSPRLPHVCTLPPSTYVRVILQHLKCRNNLIGFLGALVHYRSNLT